MAKFSNSVVVLLVLLIASWRTTPVLSHFQLPVYTSLQRSMPDQAQAGSSSEIDYGRRVKNENKASTPEKASTADQEFKKAAGEAAVLLKAKEEFSKRMVKHIETVLTSPEVVFHMKWVLLIKSAEFMRAMAGDVAEKMALVGQQHASVASADIVAALRLQKDILTRTVERCKAVSVDAATGEKQKLEIMKGIAGDLCKVSGDIAVSMSTLAEDAVGASGRVAAEAEINAKVDIESEALAKAETIAVVEAIAATKALEKAESEAIAGAEASAGAGGETKASKSSSFSASGDAGGYAGGKTDAAAITSGGGEAANSGKADVVASAGAGGEAEASKSSGGKADADASAGGGGLNY